MRQHVPPQQLWNEFHGDLEFEYDHETYWPALMKLCDDKQAEHRDRWIKGGKQYGESELYMKGGNAPSVGAGHSKAPEPALVTPSDDKDTVVLPSQQPAATETDKAAKEESA